MFCDHLAGWDGGVGQRSKREGVYVYFQLIHVVSQQKPTQPYKAIILQLKKNPGPHPHLLAVHIYKLPPL